MSTAREYWIGLPVGVTIHENGTATWTIDTSDAGEALRELWMETDESSYTEVAAYTEDQVLTDMAVATAQATFTASVTEMKKELKCPLRHSCDFRTTEIPELVAHIKDEDATHGDC